MKTKETVTVVKARVYVRVSRLVPYVIEVRDEVNNEDKSWSDRVREALLKKGPSDWESDPDFYENYGSRWAEHIFATKHFNTEIINPEKTVK